MSLNVRVTEEATVLGFIAASAGTTGSSPYLSDAVALDCDSARRVVAYLNVGTIGSSSTVDAKFQWSATSGGTYADVASTSIVQDVAGSKVHQIEILVENVKATNPTAGFVKLRVAIGVAATPFSATIVGFDGAHRPVTAGTDVGQTVALP